VHAAPAGPDATRVSPIGLDDDNQGRRTDVLWEFELELEARVLDQRAELPGEVARFDPPRTFGATTTRSAGIASPRPAPRCFRRPSALVSS
jgi:hypothetical protein